MKFINQIFKNMIEEKEVADVRGKAEERFKEIETKNRQIKDLAKWLFLIAGSIFCWVIFDYIFVHNIFYNSTERTLNNLGAILAGTSGVIVSAATMVFFIYNIKIQNEALRMSIVDVETSLGEMTKSNQNFIEQKSEHLFFNLLDNHDKLIANYNADKLNTNYSQDLARIKTYYQCVNNRKFSRREIVSDHPSLFYLGDKFLEKAVESAIHIIEYIETKLQDKEFFHKTFHNAMNPCVRFYLGFTLEENYKRCKFEVPDLYFDEYHSQLAGSLIDDCYVPPIKIEQPERDKNYKIESSVTSVDLEGFFTFGLALVDDLKNSHTKYLGFDQAISIDGKDLEPYSEKQDFELDCDVIYDFDLSGDLYNILNKFAEARLPLLALRENIMLVDGKAVQLNDIINVNVAYKLYFSYPIIGEVEKFEIKIWYNFQLRPDADKQLYNVNSSSFT